MSVGSQLVGWFGMYCAPFMVSLVPTKEFLDWDKWVLNDTWVDNLYDPAITGVGGVPDMLVTAVSWRIQVEVQFD
jgi:hypothetical protein